MASRKERLRNLVRVQEQLKAFHEMRHAGFLAEAQSAKADAAEIGASAQVPGSLSGLFPGIYVRGLERAHERERANTEKAAEEAQRIATETARVNMVERAYREVRLLEERGAEDKDRLELIQRAKPDGQR